MTIEFGRVTPVLRIFSLEKAREFYLDFLSFKVDWEHRFGPDFPIYMQVSRDGLSLHLSEHHGDGHAGLGGLCLHSWSRGAAPGTHG